MNMDLTRRRFLQASAGAGAAVLLAGRLGSGVRAQSAAPITAEPGPLNFLTWSDHWNPDALSQINSELGIAVATSDLSDNSDGLAKLAAGNSGLDLVSGDALWVPAYDAQGLLEPMDLAELAVASELYPMAKEFPFFTSANGYLAYPWGWSPIQIAYDPANVPSGADTWNLLVDPAYAGRVVMENQPIDIMLFAGKAIGAVDPYNMTDEELAKAKDWLTALKPNVLKLVAQNGEVRDALVSGEAWIGTSNLGMPDRVKDAGGPEITAFVPKEGTVGFIDGEMAVKGAPNLVRVKPYLEAAATAEWVAQNFLDWGRPLWNEKAYKVLVDMGQQERADRYLYNQPEVALQMTLKGPGGRVQDYLDTFNSVFGA